MLQNTKNLLADLIAFPTISSDSNLEIIDYIADYLRQWGIRVHIFKHETQRKANLFATIGPEGNGGVVLSGHTDVVPVADQNWSSDPFKMIESDGRLYGRGACDMKGFIACTLAMAPQYAKLDLKHPVHFAFTYDEETGCLGAQKLAKDLALQNIKPAMAIIGEPTEMCMIEGHKGMYEYTTEFSGLEGHSSRPELGVNAVEYAARYVSHLISLRKQLESQAPPASQFEPPHATINVGSIHGGVAHNVIANKSVVEWEMRPVQKSDADFVKSAIDDYVRQTLLPEMKSVHRNADIKTTTIGEVEGLIPMEENNARTLVAELTGANRVDLVAFGTEAGIFQSLGMDCIVCGPGSIAQAHKADEFVQLDQLQSCLTMLEKLRDRLCQPWNRR
ncbi:MAG: acetylornithine deacetylase [Pseudomonadota bacterium]